MRWFWQPSEEAKTIAAAIRAGVGELVGRDEIVLIHPSPLPPTRISFSFTWGTVAVNVNGRPIDRMADANLISKVFLRRLYEWDVDRNEKALISAAEAFKRAGVQ